MKVFIDLDKIPGGAQFIENYDVNRLVKAILSAPHAVNWDTVGETVAPQERQTGKEATQDQIRELLRKVQGSEINPGMTRKLEHDAQRARHAEELREHPAVKEFLGERPRKEAPRPQVMVVHMNLGMLKRDEQDMLKALLAKAAGVPDPSVFEPEIDDEETLQIGIHSFRRIFH